MPVLKQTRETKDVPLTTVEGGVAKVITCAVGEDIEKIVGSKEGGTLFPLTIIIKEWNLTNEAGEALPVTLENVRLLKLADVKALFASVEGMDDFFGQGQPAPGTK